MTGAKLISRSTSVGGPYQLLPPLSDDDFAALRSSIAERGILVPIEVDEDGSIIDGHHRYVIAQELGISDYPINVRSGLSHLDKRILARQLNVARRHLTTALKRQLIEQQLSETPNQSSRTIALMLGVDHKTVADHRRALLVAGKIPKVEKLIGRDGRKRRINSRVLDEAWGRCVLSDGEKIADISFEEVPALIRERENDLRVLRYLRDFCVPANRADRIGSMVPVEGVLRVLGGHND